MLRPSAASHALGTRRSCLGRTSEGITLKRSIKWYTPRRRLARTCLTARRSTVSDECGSAASPARRGDILNREAQARDIVEVIARHEFTVLSR